jgi:hypothetical protein
MGVPGDLPALAGRTGQALPDPYRAVAAIRGAPLPDRGCTAPRCRGEALPRPPAPDGAAIRGTHWHAATDWNGTPDERRRDGLPALAGRTGQAPPDPYMRVVSVPPPDTNTRPGMHRATL